MQTIKKKVKIKIPKDYNGKHWMKYFDGKTLYIKQYPIYLTTELNNFLLVDCKHNTRLIQNKKDIFKKLFNSIYTNITTDRLVVNGKLTITNIRYKLFPILNNIDKNEE